MTSLVEAKNNKASMEAESIGAVSDPADGALGYTSKWLEVLDRSPIGELQAIVHDLCVDVPLQPALAGLIYERIWRAYGQRCLQPDLLDDRTLQP